MNADGSGQRVLARNAYELAWSPDGRKMAFVRFHGPCPEGNFEIHVIDAHGSGQRRLTHTAAHDRGPAWSRDGRRIAFRRSDAARTPDSDIFLMNADGSGQRRLTQIPALNVLSTWFPDGRIAFASRRAPGDYEFYVMNADGSGQRNLTIEWGSTAFRSGRQTGRKSPSPETTGSTS